MNHETATPTPTPRREEDLAESTRDRPLVAPMMDIYENAEEILLVADLPGVRQEHVTIDVNKGRLSLSARRDGLDPRSPEGEFSGYDFHRSFVVPQGLDAEKITAELAAGVLRVHLPKASANKPRRIEVRAG
jgi:HSP20 family molecular chaperone IbpA